ncbi:MAG: hypothetical protein HY077_13925, partial [Elusimicrobia bacterium]|nr:hypothetical protein [Elusimicrobiota bacterium]
TPEAAAIWSFEGQVFDLITLQPVRQAQLVFKVRGNPQDWAVKTDARGRFKTILPPLANGGYELTITQSDYLEGYIDEMSPPLREAELDERRMLAGAAVRNAVWIGRPKASTKRDIFLIPKVIPADAR